MVDNLEITFLISFKNSHPSVVAMIILAKSFSLITSSPLEVVAFAELLEVPFGIEEIGALTGIVGTQSDAPA